MAFLLDDFERANRFAVRTLAIARDGLVIIRSRSVHTDMGDRLSALCSGFSSMAMGMAREFEAPEIVDVAIRLEVGFVVIVGPFDNAVLMTLAHPDANLGEVNNALVKLGQTIVDHISPTARTAL
ncbi:roadblock/LC7 domain-containing protein [Winogradskya humida]|uniref:Roadblock/LAMTOR2 domain-containing protein n=1 Tax=Winogradskya humida TaxID=113566 RepID=A0ABQ4A367_9ACTN|nr:roadblock/LC7 domain-containing protein [Actinoplanes humidus]GIE24787.1 hypothetical protein Ahu01nite_078890 [Actinoplanes humidus]